MIPIGNRDIALKRYYRNIRRCLPSSRKLKTQILAEIESNIVAYLYENPTADLPTIEARFGAPEQIASAYVDELGTPELLKKLQIRKNVITIISGIMAVILVIWVAAVAWAIKNESHESEGYLSPSQAIEITP